MTTPYDPPQHVSLHPHFLIVAYSGRALAQAANAAGLSVTVADQFGDADTRLAAVHFTQLDFASLDDKRLGDDSSVLRHLLRPSANKLGVLAADSFSPPFSGVLLGGGCETRPGLLANLAALAGKKLLGLPTTDALTRLRDREFWAVAARHAKCHFPTSMSADEFAKAKPASSDSWLLKKNASAGGLGVRRISRETNDFSVSADVYAQTCIEGRQVGVTLVVERARTRLLGCTESFASQDWQTSIEPPGVGEFNYRGSWGPIRLTEQQESQVTAIGDYCCRKTGWLGWLQLDFIEDFDQRLWLLEINPRWTAGMEVLWRSGACNPVTEHLGALGWDSGTESKPREPDWCAKAVWYAEKETTAEKLSAAAHLAQTQWSELEGSETIRVSFRDLPTPSSEVILSGQPGLTIVVQELATQGLKPGNRRRRLLELLDIARRALLRHL